MNQLYKDKDFKMLTVPEMERMEFEYYRLQGKLPDYDLIVLQTN
jgi:hypothetical protein